MEFVFLFLRWWLLGAALLWLAWRLSREMRPTWLRNTLRALVASFAFAPTLASLSGSAGLWPLPAGWVLLCCIGEHDPIELYSNLIYGGLPICIVAIGIGIGFRLLRRFGAVRATS